jgi:hypothetical protein
MSTPRNLILSSSDGNSCAFFLDNGLVSLKPEFARTMPDERARRSLQDSHRDGLARHPRFRICNIRPAEWCGARRARWLFIHTIIPVSAVGVALLPGSCGARTTNTVHNEAKALSASVEAKAARALKRHFATPSAWQKKRLQQMQGLQRVLGGAFDEFGTFSCAAAARACPPAYASPPRVFAPQDSRPLSRMLGDWSASTCS